MGEWSLKSSIGDTSWFEVTSEAAASADQKKLVGSHPTSNFSRLSDGVPLPLECDHGSEVGKWVPFAFAAGSSNAWCMLLTRRAGEGQTQRCGG